MRVKSSTHTVDVREARRHAHPRGHSTLMAAPTLSTIWTKLNSSLEYSRTRGVWFVELETLGSVVVLIIHRRLGRGRRPGSGFHARGMITALGIPRLFQRFLRSGDRNHVLLAARHLDEDRAAARSHRARIERVVARFGCRRALDERGRPLVCARRRLKPRPPQVESEAPDDDVPDRDRGEQRQDERGQRERGSREAASLAVGCDAPTSLAARLAERPAMAGAARRAARVRRRRECDAARRAQPRPRAQLHPDHGNRPAARALRRAGKSCTCFCIFCTCSSVIQVDLAASVARDPARRRRHAHAGRRIIRAGASRADGPLDRTGADAASGARAGGGGAEGAGASAAARRPLLDPAIAQAARRRRPNALSGGRGRASPARGSGRARGDGERGRWARGRVVHDVPPARPLLRRPRARRRRRRRRAAATLAGWRAAPARRRGARLGAALSARAAGDESRRRVELRVTPPARSRAAAAGSLVTVDVMPRPPGVDWEGGGSARSDRRRARARALGARRRGRVRLAQYHTSRPSRAACMCSSSSSARRRAPLRPPVRHAARACAFDRHWRDGRARRGRRRRRGARGRGRGPEPDAAEAAAAVEPPPPLPPPRPATKSPPPAGPAPGPGQLQ